MTAMETFSTQLWKFENDQRGTALIELAVVLPILLAICLGVFEFGNAIYTRHLIENGIRDAGRYIAGLPYDSTKSALLAANKTAAMNIALTGTSTTNTNYRVSYWNPSAAGFVFNVAYPTVANGPTSCGTTRCYRGPDTITMVTVSTDIPYQGLGFLGYFGLSNLTMHVEHEERLFGVR